MILNDMSHCDTKDVKVEIFGLALAQFLEK